MIYKIALFILAVFSITSCSEVLTIDDVLGEYSVKNGLKENSLVIKSDGTYIHQYKISEKKTISSQGNWEITEKVEGVIRITFKQFQFAPTRGKTKAVGMWNTVVDKSWGKVVLCFDFDLSENDGCFKKKG